MENVCTCGREGKELEITVLEAKVQILGTMVPVSELMNFFLAMREFYSFGELVHINDPEDGESELEEFFKDLPAPSRESLVPSALRMGKTAS